MSCGFDQTRTLINEESISIGKGQWPLKSIMVRGLNGIAQYEVVSSEIKKKDGVVSKKHIWN